MTAPARDVRADAKRALTRRLARAECAIPDALAAELLVILDGIHIGLVDTSRTIDPATAILPPGTGIPATADSPGLAQYRAARDQHLPKEQT